MLYLLLIVVIAVLVLVLLNMQQNNKKSSKNKEINLMQCVKCGVYITQVDMKKKNGKCYCHECLSQ